MATDKKTLIQQLLGPTPSTTATTVGNLLGGFIFGTGLYNAMEAGNGKTYAAANKDIVDSVTAMDPAFDAKADKIQADLAADLSGYQRGVEGRTAADLNSRGLTDSRVHGAARQQITQGLSGAYASARAALGAAKLRAQQGLSTALAKYNMDLAGKQYESMMKNYQAKMGIWGALGGLGGALAAAPSTASEKKQAAAEDATGRRVVPALDQVNIPMQPEMGPTPPVMLDPRYRRAK